MKALLLFLLFVSGLSAEVADVFFLCGQSNAAGKVSTGFKPDASDTSVAYHYFVDGVGAPPAVSNGWKTLGLHNRRNKLHGPEIDLGRALHKQGYKVHLIKVARGGTGLATAWNSKTGGVMWEKWKEQTKAALDALKAQGHTVKIRGFFWLQGETDARRAIHAKAYAANFNALLKNSEEHLRSIGLDPSQMVVVTAQIQPTAGKYAAQVRAAQVSVMASRPRSSKFDTASLKTKDGIHFDELGNSVIGRMFARQFLQVLK